MTSFLGLDIGGTQIKAGRADGEGRILARASIPTPASLADFRLRVPELVASLDDGTIRAAGIGCKGLIDPYTTVVQVSPGPVAYLEGHSLSEMANLRVPAIADNDARVALAGEAAWGAAKGLRNALMFTLGTGVGGGVLADGRILRGATGVAGHLGHVTIDPDGTPCICGNRGCLETLFSARAIEAEAYSAAHRAVASALRPGSSCAEVFDAAAAGDHVATHIVTRATFRLASAIAGLAIALDPEAVILGGQIATAGPGFWEPLRAEIEERTRIMLPRGLPILKSQVEDGVAGAAALALEAVR